MGSKLALSLAATVLAVASVAAQPLPRPLPTPHASATLADVKQYYDATERNIETEYAKLIQDAKSQKQGLEDQIKNLESQIERLKQTLKRIPLLRQKLHDLLPKIMPAVGSEQGAGKPQAPSPGARDQFAAMLAGELARAGINLPPDDLRNLVDTMRRGGHAGMAMALYLVIEIGEASTDKALPGSGPRENARAGFAGTPAAALQSLLGRRDYPKVTQGDLSTAAHLPGDAAAALLSGRFNGQANQMIFTSQEGIKKGSFAIEESKSAIVTLEKQIVKLEQQKQKALADAKKARDSRLVRIPTPTPKTP